MTNNTSVKVEVPVPSTCSRCNFHIPITGEWYKCVLSDKILEKEEQWDAYKQRTSWCELDKEKPVMHIK